MGEIVGAGLLAHVPTIVLPEQIRRELNNGNESTLFSGLHDLRREVFDELRPDLVLVFDSHWFTTVEFVVTSHERRLGFFTSDELPRGMSSVPFDIPGNPDFARLIGKIADETPRLLDHAHRQRASTQRLRDAQLPPVPAERRGVALARGLPDRREPGLRGRG